MIKRYFLSSLFCWCIFSAGAQTDVETGKRNNPFADSSAVVNNDIDTVAVMILDRMTAVIGGIEQACFDMEVVYDLNTEAFGYIKNSEQAKICVKDQNRIIVDIDGDKGHKGFWYDGEIFNYYSWNNNRYAQVNYTGNTIDLIDTISKTFGVEFPGIDVFYPDFTDDAIASCTRLSYLGQTVMNGKKCFHIAAKTPAMTWQLWVSNDIYFLPVKLLIRYPEQEGSPEYEVNYNKYDLNAGLPDAMFNFNPPPKAEKVKIKTK